jgi:hypothetical protein
MQVKACCKLQNDLLFEEQVIVVRVSLGVFLEALVLGDDVVGALETGGIR